MGLELIEFVLATEDAFEIDIPDADAANLETPAKLIDYLCARLGEAADGPPLLQTVYYRLRAALADELEIPRSRIAPDSVLGELTKRAEREVWTAVARRLGLDVKYLTHSPMAQMLGSLRRAPSRSVGDHARQVAMLRPAAMKLGKPWTRAQTTEVVLKLLHHEIAIDVGLGDLDRSFIRDLGMG
jgi:hypothetical protein